MRQAIGPMRNRVMHRMEHISNLSRIIILCLLLSINLTEASAETTIVPISDGWSKNSINAGIARHNSVVTHDDTQYVAFYDAYSHVVLAKRSLGSTHWEMRVTPYKGNVKDAHNSISIMVDGNGFLHMAWDHHNSPLRYCRGKSPGSLELTDLMPMTGKREGRVTYPEFYRLPDGNLLFMYRDGASGRGNVMMNHYDIKSKKWTQRQDAFVSGEGQRSAYWQTCIDKSGTIHISWVWRETNDVATNHDMCYAKSTDQGRTWQKSTGANYNLPITARNAEYAVRIPQNSSLINTTSMFADPEGNPYIVSYWIPSGTVVPQYHLIYNDGSKWRTSQISRRRTSFNLSGRGTKRVPISRSRILANADAKAKKLYMLFRDIERGNRVSIAICNDLKKSEWQFKDLTDFSVGQWEPSFDTELWKQSKLIHVYIQKVGQGDGESMEAISPQQVAILEWKPD